MKVYKTPAQWMASGHNTDRFRKKHMTYKTKDISCKKTLLQKWQLGIFGLFSQPFWILPTYHPETAWVKSPPFIHPKVHQVPGTCGRCQKASTATEEAPEMANVWEVIKVSVAEKKHHKFRERSLLVWWRLSMEERRTLMENRNPVVNQLGWC